MEELFTSRQKSRLTQSIRRASKITQEEWNFYLVKAIRRFQKKQDKDFFGLVKDWIIAEKFIPLEQYEFIYSTPLIEILVTHLTDLSLIQSPKVLLNILQIVANLTAFTAPDVSAFLNETLLKNYTSFLSHENPKIIKFTLVILSQLLYKEPILIDYFNSINLYEQLISNFLTSDHHYISGVSCFMLCQFAYSNNDNAASVFQILFQFVSNGEIHAVSKLFQSFLFFSQKSPEFLLSLISCDFCQLSAITLSNAASTSSGIALSIFSILNLFATSDIGIQSIQSANIIHAIIEFNYLDPSNNPQLLLSVMNLLSLLVQKAEPNIDQQLITDHIFEVCSELATTTSYGISIDYLIFICTSLQRKNIQISEIIMNFPIISRIFDIFETLDNRITIFVIQSLLSLLDTKPDAKQIILENDIESIIVNANERKEQEIDELVQLLINIVDKD